MNFDQHSVPSSPNSVRAAGAPPSKKSKEQASFSTRAFNTSPSHCGAFGASIVMSGRIARASRNAVLKCAGVRTSFSYKASNNWGTRSRSFCFPSKTTSNAADANNDNRDGSPSADNSSRAQATTSSTTSMEKYSATAALHLPRYLSSSNGTEVTSSRSVSESFDLDFFFFYLYPSSSCLLQ